MGLISESATRVLKFRENVTVSQPSILAASTGRRSSVVNKLLLVIKNAPFRSETQNESKCIIQN